MSLKFSDRLPRRGKDMMHIFYFSMLLYRKIPGQKVRDFQISFGIRDSQISLKVLIKQIIIGKSMVTMDTSHG